MQYFSNQFIKFYLVIGLLIISSCTNQVNDNELNVDGIIKSLSLEQKAMLVVGIGMHLPFPDSVLIEAFGDRPNNPFLKPINADSNYIKMVNKLNLLVPGSAGKTTTIPELGITTQVLADGPAGLRIEPKRDSDTNTYFATAFPIATCLASTWNTELVEEVGKAMGNEVLEYGVDVILGPGLNLQRNPLCGRNFEYYSEDPLISGKMAAAIVNGIQSNGVGTSIKHYAVNNQETNRHTVNAVVSERALRELYLKGFRIAVQESQPWTVMSSYNLLNGVYTSESYDLLTKILRDEWGFRGYVMTDWTAGNNPVAQMKAGNDLLMPGDTDQIKTIINAIKDGSLNESVLDTNVKRILNIMIKTPTYKKNKTSNKPDLKYNAEVTRQAGSEGMVLLKNKEKALPINKDLKSIAIYGIGSYSTYTGGSGSGDVNEAYSMSIVDGLKNADYQILKSLEEIYLTYLMGNKAPDLGLLSLLKGSPITPEMVLSKELISESEKESDIAILTISRNSGEGIDRKPIAGDFYLTDNEKFLINEVSNVYHKNGKKVIVVLNIGGVIETSSWNDKPDAIIIAWQPGQEAGNSLSDILSGKVNPSGKLAISFPNSYDDVPSSNTFPGHKIEKFNFELKRKDDPFVTNVPWEEIYEDDIYVGYRYYNTFNVPVAYEFGFGLSYTSFEFINLSTSTEEFNNSIDVQINVVNTGSLAGKEVVQLYISAPQVKLEKPEEELKAFAKTKLLNPGTSQIIKMKLNSMDLASFDESTSSWIIEPGEYEIKIGTSSRKIKQKATFKVQNEIVVQKLSKALSPKVEFNKLTRKELLQNKAVGF